MPSDEELGEHVIGTTVGIFFHELGHAFISLYDLAAVGAQEDVADEFSAMMLIAIGREDAIGYEIALSSAQTFLDIWEQQKQQAENSPDRLPHWDEHALDIKRATNILCLLYGAEPDRFAGLMTRLGAPEATLKKCAWEFQRKEKAWEKLLEPHVWPEGEVPPPDAPKFAVEYLPVKTDFGKLMERHLKANRSYERLAATLNSLFKLPQPVTIKVGECGFANAFWKPDESSITMCYELMQVLGELRLKSAAGQSGAPGPAPVVSIAGVWNGQMTDMFGFPASVQMVLDPRGAFTQTVQSQSGFVLQVWGRYAVNGQTIEFFIEGWQPRQWCGPMGCSPVSLPSHDRTWFQFQEPNVIQTGNGVFYRQP